MKILDSLKLFHSSYQLLNADLDAVEGSYGVNLGRTERREHTQDETFYPQFTSAVRTEAAQMARHYEIFYCLENSIRELVTAQLVATVGDDWWSTVPDAVKDNVKRNYDRERESGITLRSSEMIDYTTFGELGDIIRANWQVFGAIFKSERALTKILNSLNSLRAPIAHCSLLADDEVLRLQLSLRDWFRLMS